MAQNIIDTGGTANDGTGDSIRSGFQKVNSNFTEVYTVIPRVTSVETSITNLTSLVAELETIVGSSTGTSKQYVDYSTSLVYNSLITAFTSTTIASTASLTARVTTLEGGAGTLTARVTSLETSTATLATRAGSLETRATNLEASYTNVISSLTSKASIVYVDTVAASSTASIASSLQALRTDFATPGSLTGATYTAFTSLVSNSTGSFGTRVTNLEASYTNILSTVSSKASISYVDTVVATSTASIASSLQSLRTDFSTPGSLTGATYTAFTSLVSNSTGSFATRVTNLESSFTNFVASGGSGASVLYVDTAVANSTASIASSLQALRTDFATPGSLAGSTYTALTTLISTSTGSFATRVTNLESSFTNFTSWGGARISDIDTAVATSTGSFATRVANIESSVGTLTTTVTSFAGSINGVLGKYGVTVNNNGAISGYVLNSGGTTSSFIVSADQFKIYTDGGTKIPFSVAGDVVSMQNVNVASTLTVGSSPLVSGTSMTGAGARINSNGTFALGNSTTNISYNGSQMYLNGNIIGTGNIQVGAVTNSVSYPILGLIPYTHVGVGDPGYPDGARGYISTTTSCGFFLSGSNSVLQISGIVGYFISGVFTGTTATKLGWSLSMGFTNASGNNVYSSATTFINGSPFTYMSGPYIANGPDARYSLNPIDASGIQRTGYFIKTPFSYVIANYYLNGNTYYDFVFQLAAAFSDDAGDAAVMGPGSYSSGALYSVIFTEVKV